MAKSPRVARLPVRTVRVLAAALPVAVRDRYQREFLSELFGMTRWQRVRYSIDIMIHVVSLRMAVRRQAAPAATLTSTAPRAPLSCRIHLYHQWVTLTTTDGERYHQCRGCGKDRTDFGDPPMSRGITSFGGYGHGGFG
jgi:hypothetical protein